MATTVVTAEFVQGALGSDLTPEQSRRVVEVAEQVYAHVRAMENRGAPFQDESDVRNWGERNDITVDEMTRALRLLGATGRVHIVAQAAADLPLPPPDAPSRVVPLDEMTNAELAERARELEIEGRSTLSPQQLRNRIKKTESAQPDVTGS